MEMTGKTQRITRKSKHGCDSENEEYRNRRYYQKTFYGNFPSFIEFYFISGFISIYSSHIYFLLLLLLSQCVSLLVGFVLFCLFTFAVHGTVVSTETG